MCLEYAFDYVDHLKRHFKALVSTAQVPSPGLFTPLPLLPPLFTFMFRSHNSSRSSERIQAALRTMSGSNWADQVDEEFGGPNSDEPVLPLPKAPPSSRTGPSMPPGGGFGGGRDGRGDFYDAPYMSQGHFGGGRGRGEYGGRGGRGYDRGEGNYGGKIFLDPSFHRLCGPAGHRSVQTGRSFSIAVGRRTLKRILNQLFATFSFRHGL